MDLMNQSTLGLGLIYATTKISVVEEIFIFPPIRLLISYSFYHADINVDWSYFLTDKTN